MKQLKIESMMTVIPRKDPRDGFSWVPRYRVIGVQKTSSCCALCNKKLQYSVRLELDNVACDVMGLSDTNEIEIGVDCARENAFESGLRGIDINSVDLGLKRLKRELKLGL